MLTINQVVRVCGVRGVIRHIDEVFIVVDTNNGAIAALPSDVERPGRITISIFTNGHGKHEQIEIDAVHVDACGLAIHKEVLPPFHKDAIRYGKRYFLAHVTSGRAMFSGRINTMRRALRDLKAVIPDWTPRYPTKDLPPETQQRFRHISTLYNKV